MKQPPNRDPLSGGGSFVAEVIGIDEWQLEAAGDEPEWMAALDLDNIVVVEAPYNPDKIRALFDDE